MSGTSGRLLTLLSLLQTPREWPGSELAGRLRVSLRTVRRDVERLRDLGYPVQASMGAEGGYRPVAGTAMPPLLLDDEEAVAIAVGLRTVTRHAVDGIDQASVRAMAKLQQGLPSRLRRRVEALNAATMAPPAMSGPSIDPEVLTVTANTTNAPNMTSASPVSHIQRRTGLRVTAFLVGALRWLGAAFFGRAAADRWAPLRRWCPPASRATVFPRTAGVVKAAFVRCEARRRAFARCDISDLRYG